MNDLNPQLRLLLILSCALGNSAAHFENRVAALNHAAPAQAFSFPMSFEHAR